MSVEVNEAFVAVTGEGKLIINTYKKDHQINNSSPESLLTWNNNTIIVPLMSLFQQSIKFKIYRELLPITNEIDEFHGELLAWAGDEELFAKEIWSKPNR